MHKKIKIIFISSFVFIVSFFAFFLIQKNTPSPKSFAAETTKPAVVDISFTVIVGKTTFHLVSQEGRSLYDALFSAKENEQITFAGKNYPALGFFVTDINFLHGGNGKNLIYYINNKEASTGISLYLPKNGDVVEWKLE